MPYAQLATALEGTASRLGRIQAPTLVLRGGRDALLPPAHARMLAERIPDAELAEVEGIGHLYLFERLEESLSIVADWIRRRSP